MSDLSTDDIMAAEYAIGLLDPEQRALADRRLDRDPVWAGLVAAWRMRLSQMDAQFGAVPAPNVLPRIQRQLFGSPARRAWLPGVPVPAIIGVVLVAKALALWLLLG